MTVNEPQAMPVPESSRKRPRNRRQPRFTTTSAVVTYVLIAISALLPVPYLLQVPGPVFDTLGDFDGKPMISINGAQTYPTDGRLDMLTVGVSGGPGRYISASDALTALFGKKETVVPTEAYYPLETTQSEISASNAVEMSSSQDVAIAAAMEELKLDYTVNLLVDKVVPGSPAEAELSSGDRIVSVNGQDLGSDPDAATKMTSTVQSSDSVQLVVDRAGKSVNVTVTPQTIEGRKAIGINMRQEFDFPVDVNFNVGNVGGPSAGTMFALAIVDELTPGSLTGGKHVAGTGEISPSGKVGPIGGARQKVAAATAEGATLFLSPADNCAEVMEAADQSKITVTRIDTLDDARSAVEKYAAGQVSDLPSCDASGANPNEKG